VSKIHRAKKAGMRHVSDRHGAQTGREGVRRSEVHERKTTKRGGGRLPKSTKTTSVKWSSGAVGAGGEERGRAKNGCGWLTVWASRVNDSV